MTAYLFILVSICAVLTAAAYMQRTKRWTYCDRCGRWTSEYGESTCREPANWDCTDRSQYRFCAVCRWQLPTTPGEHVSTQPACEPHAK